MSALGWLGAGIARGRFGGVVGKVVLMFGCVGTAAGLAIYGAGGNTYAAAAAVAVALLAAVVVGMVLAFAHYHPDVALLDGADWLTYQGMMQAKGKPPWPVSNPTSGPASTPVLDQLAAPLAIPEVVEGKKS